MSRRSAPPEIGRRVRYFDEFHEVEREGVVTLCLSAQFTIITDEGATLFRMYRNPWRYAD